MCRIAPIYSVPLYLARSAVHVLRTLTHLPLFVAYLLAYVFAALAYVLYRLGDCYIFNNMSLGLFFTCARCACLCVCLLMPGQRWTF